MLDYSQHCQVQGLLLFYLPYKCPSSHDITGLMFLLNVQSQGRTKKFAAIIYSRLYCEQIMHIIHYIIKAEACLLLPSGISFFNNTQFVSESFSFLHHCR